MFFSISLNKVIFWASTVLFITVISSCHKFLDKKQDAKLIVPTTLPDLQRLLDDGSTMNSLRTPSMGETSADDYFVTNDYYDLIGSALGESYQHFYIWQQFFDENAENDWGVVYQPVYNTNLVLDVLKNIPQNASNEGGWDNIKGSALFYRSYYFLSLLWNYAKAYDSTSAKTDLGIVLRLTSNFNEPSVRSTNEECYMQVLNDTKAAIPLLPDYPQNKLRPSKGAAYGLLARCYLSMRDYKEASTYADSCLQLNNQLMDYNHDDDIDDASSMFKRLNKETVFYTEMNNSGVIFNTGAGLSYIDTALYESYQENDLRKMLYFSTYGDGYYYFTGSYASSVTACFSGIAADEMYLIMAECLIRLGNKENGLSYLNSLMIKRYREGSYLAPEPNSPDEALAIVLNQRRKELLMRGLRWMDIKRLNKENHNIVLERKIKNQSYTLLPNSDYYALPIPEDIIKITGMPQND